MNRIFLTVKLFLLIFLLNLFVVSYSLSKPINKIIINGNERITSETIQMFSNVNNGDQINSSILNQIIKGLYETNFFSDVSVIFEDNILKISVVENPIIQNINYEGIKSEDLKEKILKNIKLKERTSFNDFLLDKDKEIITSNLRNEGYYFSKIEVKTNVLEDNKVDIEYKISPGNKSKIKKITFIGNKVFKDKKLKNIIVSEESKFWKFLSNKKYLNKNIIDLDVSLLKNFYLNKGYYSIQVRSTFAKMDETGNFELVYNIDAKEKFFFNNLELKIPDDFNRENYEKVTKLFSDLKGENYSIYSIEKILEKIEAISIQDEYESIKATVEENIVQNKIDLLFEIKETERYFVDRINIFGNNVTQENVIRNQFEIDEGDPFNDILAKKSVNSVKALGFFNKVEDEIITDEINKTKVINLSVTEKPTGEILAGAGIGTSGGSATFSVKENNYLGKGIGLQASTTIDDNTIRGKFAISNPNFLNSDKTARFLLESSETDLLKSSGYKSNKTGISAGTNFEYLEDLSLGFTQSFFYESIDTISTASKRQRAQEGDYWDSFLKFDIDYDKRNQKYQTSSGFRSFYSANIPIISETNTLTNTLSYSIYDELYENNVSKFSFFARTARSVSGDDVKLSERLFLPENKLRGFERAKTGPKDGDDFIGGNFISSINISSTLPQILPNSQNTDFLVFFDAANIWGVDYDQQLNSSNKIRSSIGVGIDMFTILGPLNFSLSQPLTKKRTDITERFRFNLGTTF